MVVVEAGVVLAWLEETARGIIMLSWVSPGYPGSLKFVFQAICLITALRAIFLLYGCLLLPMAC